MIKKKKVVHRNFEGMLVDGDTLTVFKSAINKLKKDNTDLYAVISEHREITEQNQHIVNKALESIETNNQFILRTKQLMGVNNMRKKYKLSEVLAAYENGFKGEFRKVLGGKIVNMVNGSIYLDGSVLELSHTNVHGKYIKVRKAVTPIEALQALMKGKTIIGVDEDGDEMERYSKGDRICLKVFEDYKWYIE